MAGRYISFTYCLNIRRVLNCGAQERMLSLILATHCSENLRRCGSGNTEGSLHFPGYCRYSRHPVYPVHSDRGIPCRRRHPAVLSVIAFAPPPSSTEKFSVRSGLLSSPKCRMPRWGGVECSSIHPRPAPSDVQCSGHNLPGTRCALGTRILGSAVYLLDQQFARFICRMRFAAKISCTGISSRVMRLISRS